MRAPLLHVRDLMKMNSPFTHSSSCQLVGGHCCLVAESCLTLCDPWTVACQAPLSMEFSRQEHWSRLPFPPPGDHPDPGIKSTSLVSCTGRRRSLPLVPAGKPILNYPNHNTRTPCIGVIIFQGIRRLRRWFIFGSLVLSWHTAGT